MTYRVHTGDVSAILPTLDAESFDAVLCDPPYGLSFMGKAWDHGVPSADVWAAVSRTLKPGAHLIAFGGTRTFHRLTCAIEDAGFEIRDCLCWLQGQGFPKSLDISKAIDKAAGAERTLRVNERWAERYPNGPGGNLSGGDRAATVRQLKHIDGGPLLTSDPVSEDAIRWQGYGTALKPAWEPAILAMKPTAGTFAENALAHGVAGLNVDGCRLAPGRTTHADGNRVTSVAASGMFPKKPHGPTPPPGRWPSNVALDEEAAAMLPTTGGGGKPKTRYRAPSAVQYTQAYRPEYEPYPDALAGGGPASRFFYVAKAGTAERSAGLPGGKRSHHPTVKPIALAEWLAKLLLPPKRDTPRRLLVPFSGSGSEMIGALRAGWDEVVGIEREPEYVEIAEARLAHWTSGLNRTIFDEGAA